MTSADWPRLARPEWLTAPDFDYAGVLDFDLHGARVVRHHYVDAAGGLARRQLIVQLEGFPADSDRSYHWQVEHPLRIGGVDHEHGVYAWSVATFTQADPEAEVGRTARFLSEHGYQQGDGQLMSRLARVVGEARRREVIVFYQEDLELLGLELGEIADDEGTLRPETGDLADEVTTRSLAAFEILERPYAELGLDG